MCRAANRAGAVLDEADGADAVPRAVQERLDLGHPEVEDVGGGSEAARRTEPAAGLETEPRAAVRTQAVEARACVSGS